MGQLQKSSALGPAGKVAIGRRTLTGTNIGHATSEASCCQELVVQSDCDLYRASTRGRRINWYGPYRNAFACGSVHSCQSDPHESRRRASLSSAQALS